MSRAERFAQYQWAAWPDERLNEAAQHLYMPYIHRVEQKLAGLPVLVVELGGEYFADARQVQWKYADHSRSLNGHERMLRLTWDTQSLERIYALETIDDFYAGFLRGNHPHHAGVSGPFAEVVSDPDPWLMQLLRDSPDTGVFPPYGQEGEPNVLEYMQTMGQFGGTGRFYPELCAHNAELPDLTPKQRAMARMRAGRQQQLAGTGPRYRHLFIASNSVMLEILCVGLPRWEWVDSPAEG